MKYYSEETVKRLLENKVYHTLKECPSIEIKEPHGRCIDADSFKSKLIRARDADSPNKEKTYNKALDILWDAPTVLGTSDGE